MADTQDNGAVASVSFKDTFQRKTRKQVGSTASLIAGCVLWAPDSAFGGPVFSFGRVFFTMITSPETTEVSLPPFSWLWQSWEKIKG